ncbi:MAG: four helix bundle protein [Candidatus Omnitrophica bacterium]|nr:four helix bundle protein [Candidatus Omnitrophota bacterium]
MKFSFEELEVWRIALDFAEKIYTTTQKFPKEEIYGVTNQLRRASLSISLNIAEGKGRYSNKEFKQFLFLSRGSLYETITLLKLCLRLKYLSEERYQELIKDCEVMQSKLAGLLNYLKTRINP